MEDSSTGPRPKARGAFFKDWLWQNGALAVVILFGVWVILGLYRLNLSIREVSGFLLNAPAELRESAAALKRDIKEAERVAGELRRKTEALDAELQASVLRERLGSAQDSAFKMSAGMKQGMEDVQQMMQAMPTAEARAAAAVAAAATSEAVVQAAAARAKKSSDSVIKFEAGAGTSVVALEKELAGLKEQTAILSATLERLQETAAKIEKDLAKPAAPRSKGSP